MRLIKILVLLLLAAIIALVGYAYLGDMEPQRSEVREGIPITDGELSPMPEAETVGNDTNESTEAEGE